MCLAVARSVRSSSSRERSPCSALGRVAVCHLAAGLRHHVVGFVPSTDGSCATTQWTWCHHVVGFVPPYWGFVPPCGGLGAYTRWALCHHSVGLWPTCCGLALLPSPAAIGVLHELHPGCGWHATAASAVSPGCCVLQLDCSLPPPRYQSRGYGGAAPAALWLQLPYCSC